MELFSALRALLVRRGYGHVNRDDSKRCHCRVQPHDVCVVWKITRRCVQAYSGGHHMMRHTSVYVEEDHTTRRSCIYVAEDTTTRRSNIYVEEDTTTRRSSSTLTSVVNCFDPSVDCFVVVRSPFVNSVFAVDRNAKLSRVLRLMGNRANLLEKYCAFRFGI